MLKTKIIRKCERCGFEEEQNRFAYLGDCVWSCPKCGSKYTCVHDVIEKQEAT